MMQRDSVLVVDDESQVREAICSFFEQQNIAALPAPNCGAAVEMFQRARPDAVVLDYYLPDGNAISLLEKLKSYDPVVPCVVLTGHGSIDLAVKAIKAGAEQFLTKPIDFAALRLIVDRAIESRRERKNDLAGKVRERRQCVDPFQGSSAAIRQLSAQAEKVVSAECPILILGETGSGKGVLARWIHEHSPRAREAFVDMNCAGFARELLETELFGHEKGAFTGAVNSKVGLFEVAHRGSIFLDEIGDMDPQLQPKLLKVLEERRFRRLGDVKDREINIRLIAATHQDLAALVRAKRFRPDLYFRINTVALQVPAMRERPQDIPELAAGILARLSAELGRPDLALEPDAVAALVSYEWPGNVRELRNVLERAALLSDSTCIGRRELQFEPTAGEDDNDIDYSNFTLEQLERQHIRRILALEKGHVPRAAARLGIPRSTLYHKLKVFSAAEANTTDHDAA